MNRNLAKKDCKYCGVEVTLQNIKRHETNCIENPTNIGSCPVCKKTFNSKFAKTCSHACANTYFRSGMNNPNAGENAHYRTICFHHHGKKCVICAEELIVEVHHINVIHTDNRPENLMPLCPTHHQYMHSRHKHLFESMVDGFVDKFQGMGKSG